MKIDQEYELAPVKRLRPHPDNPNRGNVELIQDSIRTNTWYGAVIAQKKTRRILAGEHRWRAAKECGAKVIPVIWKDVDDRTALRIMLVDNEAARQATYDEEVLARVLETLTDVPDEDLAGTGFSLADLEAIHDQQEEEDDGDDDEESSDDDFLPDPGDDSGMGTKWGVLVMVGGETQQQALFDEMKERGLVVRCVAV